jgi:guanylate kinase
VGPTSSGKNTIIDELLKTGNYHQIVSDTTRKPRENKGVLEQNGREYWFRSEEEVLEDLRQGEFLEAAIIHDQQVSGISIRELERAAQEHKIAINEVETNGAHAIYTAKPDAFFFFVVPPSFDEWMARMTARGALPEDEVLRRLSSAVQELTTGLSRPYYRFVVNETFVQAAKRIDNIVRENPSPSNQEQAKDVAGRLLNDTRAYLASRSE